MNNFFSFKFSNNEHVSNIIGCLVAVGFEVMAFGLILYFVRHHIRNAKRAVHICAAFVGSFIGLYVAKIMTSTFLRFFTLPSMDVDDAVYVLFVLCNIAISASIFGLLTKGGKPDEDDSDNDQGNPAQES
jgi:hypothetical protein